nr:MAG TPA: hypothetical protein [Caudoviricetes sp.]
MLQQPIKLNYKQVPLSELDFFNLEPYFLKFIKKELGGLARIEGLAYVDIDYYNWTKDCDDETISDLDYVVQFTQVKREFKDVVLENCSVGKCYTCNYHGHHLVLFQGEDTVYGYGLVANKDKEDKIQQMGVYNVKENL